MRHLKSVPAISAVLEKLTHVEDAARHDANEHKVDASKVLQHLHAARQDLLEAEREIAELIEILGTHNHDHNQLSEEPTDTGFAQA